MDDDPRPRSGPDAEGTEATHAGHAGTDATSPEASATAGPETTGTANAGPDATATAALETTSTANAGPEAASAASAAGHAGVDAEVVDPLDRVPPALDPLWTLLKSEVIDRVPEIVRDTARSSLGWRDPDSALAALVADSAADDNQLAYVRGATGPGQPRLLTFATGQLTIEVEVTPVPGPGGAATVNLVGQLVPPGSSSVAIDHSAGTVDVPPDAMGRFQVTGLGPGPLRLRCGAETADAVRTDWFLP